MRAYAGWDYVGAEGYSYPEVAARAVQSAHGTSPSPAYGYLREGMQQKIYLFPGVDDARGWFVALVHGQQPHDYAAVFAAVDLSRPVPGLESFGHTTVSGDAYVGQLWPFFLGLPLGALGGYFLRRWQEGHPGQALPFVPPGKLPAPTIPGPPSPAKTSGDYEIGGPWLDIEPLYPVDPWLAGQDYAGYTVGGPWLDVVGAQGFAPHLEGAALSDDYARRRTWPQTKALIQSAIKEVVDASSMVPGAGAYVWSLDPPSAAPSSRITLEGTTYIEAFPSAVEALEYMRQRIQTPHVALALFDRRSSHWPNPTSWSKSDNPAYEPIIAAQAAKVGDRVGAYPWQTTVGAYPWQTTIGTALDDVRSRAQSIANKRAGSVVGVIHTTKDGLWHGLAFRNSDDADDWLGTATQDPSSYTYAAYYDKEDYSWPHPVNEKIGGGRSGPRSGEPIRRGPALTSGWGAA